MRRRGARVVTSRMVRVVTSKVDLGLIPKVTKVVERSKSNLSEILSPRMSVYSLEVIG